MAGMPCFAPTDRLAPHCLARPVAAGACAGASKSKKQPLD
jgi:hypothetical protein